MSRQRAIFAGEALVTLAALGWILLLVARPVTVPVGEISRDIVPHVTQVLSGVKGQTFVAADRLSRLDLWVRTIVPEGSYVRVKFELARGVANRQTLASGIVVFDRSRDGWPVHLSFDPSLTRAGEPLYLRLEALLNTPYDALYVEYSRQNVYPFGELLEHDRLDVPGQDLMLFHYAAPRAPKPLAWVEALVRRTLAPAAAAGIEQDWLLAVVLAALVVTLGAVAWLAARIVPPMLPWQPTRLTARAVGLAVVAALLFVLFAGELPFGVVAITLT
ncbi:MAG: hypothetical protein FJ029_07130 [Actinobacteria bacterium]|nr:hypothetical protein [Actinomycetota bacterium]